MKRYSNQFVDYTMYTESDALTELHTTVQGLSAASVAERRKEYGLNQVETHHRSWVYIFIDQWRSPFLYLLIAVALVSFCLNNHLEGAVVIAIVLLNTLIGFFQEYRAEKTAQVLKSYLATKVKIMRDGQEVEIDAKELVPGDILVMYPGDIIAADVRIVQAQNLTIDESVLTGESVSVPKSAEPLKEPTKEIFAATNVGFVGTTVVTGKALGVVFAIGKESSLGHIATLAQATTRLSSFSKIVARFSKFIMYMVAISLLVIIVVHVVVKGSRTNIIDLLLFASALAISVVPEALPIVMTFALSQGALRLARNKVVVKRLSAIEDLGNIEILCTDKTGTLTENKLSVANIRAADEREIVRYASLSGVIPNKHMAPIKGFDSALHELLTDEEKQQLHDYIKVSEIPFDPSRLRSVSLIKHGALCQIIVRGAYEHIINHCMNVTNDELQKLQEWIAQEGKNGNRVLAVAIKQVTVDDKQEYNLIADDVEQGLSFVGLISFNDPIKKTAAIAVSKAQNLGLSLKVLSGDSKEVCAAVAHQLGIISDRSMVITGAEFAAETEYEKKQIVQRYNVFARVSPEHKYQIIQLLQQDYDVGYMGDGINDVLALKEAHVGLAVADAVDVAREAADIILLKKSLLVIVDGVGEGRRVFANTLKYLRITLSISFGNFYSIGIAALFLDFLPMLPVQILLCNFLTDLPMIAIATDTVQPTEMQRPAKYDIKSILILATFLGVISSLFDFVYFAKFIGSRPAILQTGWFIMNVITQMLFIFSIRTSRLFFRGGLPSIQLIIASMISVAIAVIIPETAFGQGFFSFITLPMLNIAWIIGISLAYFCVTETVKNIYYYVVRDKKNKIGMA